MRAIPQIHYAKRDEYHLAYTVTGGGPLEPVYLVGFVSHLDLLWEDPDAARFLDRLGRFCRLVVMDKRGIAWALSLTLHTPAWCGALLREGSLLLPRSVLLQARRYRDRHAAMAHCGAP